ncbi:MAG: hypothetical protein UIK35_06855 [Coprococcus catus]|nr:hypothetical protein [Coprococcus catus]
MKKIWRIRKRLIAGCLVVVLVLSMIFVPTKKAYAIVGFDDAAFILAMMAAAGIGFVGYNAYNGSNLAEDLWDELGSLEDDISDAYDKAVFTVLQGGGGGSDPDDFDPDNDDPEKKPTTWQKLKEWWKKHPNKALSMAATGSTIGYIMNVFGDNLNNKITSSRFSVDGVKFTDAQREFILSHIDDYPYYLLSVNQRFLDMNYIRMFSSPLYIWGSIDIGNYKSDDGLQTSDGITFVELHNISSGFSKSPNIFFTNVVIYSSRNEALLNFDKDNIVYSSSLNPDSVLKTDARKKADEKTDEEEKKKPVFDNVVIPTPDQMTSYVEKLNAIAQSSAENAEKLKQQQQAMNTFVESITNVKEMPNPDPSPDPNPSPNPDPSPDPEPSPEPDPDAPATDEEAAKYTADLTTVFPFCIPFDLIRAFKVLSAEGEAPVYKMPLKIDYKSIHVSEAWQIDMSDFASVIQILRVMETLGFIVGLILVTRKLIRG